MSEDIVYTFSIIEARTFERKMGMPWKEKSVEKMREEFVRQVLSKQKSKSELCREYDISRPTGDKWIQRYLNNEELSDRSKAPFKTANKTPEATEQFIVEYRKKYPAIGAVKIHRMLKDEGHTNIPCPSTINEIFKRNGLITKESSLAATPVKRFQKEHPNEMWQADFKGDFLMQDNQRCFPLNILDDCTRFNLCCEPLLNVRFETVKPVIERIFYEYGMPFSFLCDNGNPWGVAQGTGFSLFEVWLMDLGILTLHGRILHPQTQGKEESFNGSMKRELLKHTSIADVNDAREKFIEYREFFNNKRPHHALHLDTPAKHYTKSNKEYDSKIEQWEYPQEYIIHKVKSTGYFSYKGHSYFLSESFADKEIAVKESSKNGCVNLYYRQFIIGRLNVDKRAYEFKRAYLINGDPRYSR